MHYMQLCGGSNISFRAAGGKDVTAMLRYAYECGKRGDKFVPYTYETIRASLMDIIAIGRF